MKVYAVLLDDYKTIVALFDTREKATEFISNQKGKEHYLIDVCVIN